MAIVQPYSGAGSQRLVAMINRVNNISLDLDQQVILSAPEGFQDANGRNTKVHVTPKFPKDKNKGFVEKDIHYTRLPLSVLNNLPEGAVTSVFIESLPFTIHGILQSINAALGIDLDVSEVEDAEFTEALPQYPLVIKNEVSLAWIADDFQFKARHPSEDIPLSDVLRDGELDGLAWQQQ